MKGRFRTTNIFSKFLVCGRSTGRWLVNPKVSSLTPISKFLLFRWFQLPESFRNLFLAIFQICKFVDFRTPTTINYHNSKTKKGNYFFLNRAQTWLNPTSFLEKSSKLIFRIAVKIGAKFELPKFLSPILIENLT